MVSYPRPRKNRSGDGAFPKRSRLDFSLVRRLIPKLGKDDVHSLFGEGKESILLCSEVHIPARRK
jgi:hypothetical protein